ncbi:MAG: hypothetical protein GX945_05920 [Lentisphaerae bacterium]|nr:hypothetical protein [Lentisphaerota bacterium]
MLNIDVGGILQELPAHWRSILIAFALGFLAGGFIMNRHFWAWLTARAAEKRKREEEERQREEQRRLQEAEEAKRKAYEALRAQYEHAPDSYTLVAKDGSDTKHYCLLCATRSKKILALESHGHNRWFCPNCGWRSWPRRYGPNGIE